MKQKLDELIQEPLEEYLEKKDYISADDICAFRKSPMHYWLCWNSEFVQERQIKNIKLNTAIHIYLQNKDEFNSKYACLPLKSCPQPRKSFFDKENKLFRDITFPQMSNGKIAIEENEYNLIIKMCEKVENIETVFRLFKSGKNCISTYKLDHKTQLIKKSRISRLPDFGKSMYDISICKDTSDYSFSKEISYNGYHNQAAYNLELFDKEQFIFIALEDSELAMPQVHLLDSDCIEKGKEENRMYLDLICWSFNHNYWGDYNCLKILKQIYIDNNLYDKDISTTFDTLNQYFDQKKQSRGINIVGLPNWYKG